MLKEKKIMLATLTTVLIRMRVVEEIMLYVTKDGENIPGQYLLKLPPAITECEMIITMVLRRWPGISNQNE